MLKSTRFARGWVSFGEYLGLKGTIPSNPRWSGKTKDITVSYGVEILTDNYFCCRNTRIWQTDRRTNRIVTAIPCVALHDMLMFIRRSRILSRPVLLPLYDSTYMTEADVWVK